MKFYNKPIIAILMSFLMLFTSFIPVYAENSTDELSSSINSSAIQISYDELPDDYKSIISKDAIIFLEPDGSYDIYQDTPVYQVTNQNSSSSKSPLKASGSRYAPNGGSYTDLQNGWITALTCVVYQTYLPRNKVDIWISSQVPDIKKYILSKFGSVTTGAIVKYISTKWGYGFLASAVVEIANGTSFLLSWLNFNQVKSASNSGQNGILIEYLTSIGSGNSRVYSSWTSSYVPTNPYGGSATWHSGDYYVMP